MRILVFILCISVLVNCVVGLTEREIVDALSSEKMLERGVLKEVKCISCRAGMSTVASLVKDVLKRVALKKLKARCSTTDNTKVKAMCDKFAEKDGQQMTDLLVDFLSPEKFCPVVSGCEEKK